MYQIAQPADTSESSNDDTLWQRAQVVLKQIIPVQNQPVARQIYDRETDAVRTRVLYLIEHSLPLPQSGEQLPEIYRQLAFSRIITFEQKQEQQKRAQEREEQDQQAREQYQRALQALASHSACPTTDHFLEYCRSRPAVAMMVLKNENPEPSTPSTRELLSSLVRCPQASRVLFEYLLLMPPAESVLSDLLLQLPDSDEIRNILKQTFIRQGYLMPLDIFNTVLGFLHQHNLLDEDLITRLAHSKPDSEYGNRAINSLQHYIADNACHKKALFTALIDHFHYAAAIPMLEQMEPGDIVRIVGERIESLLLHGFIPTMTEARHELLTACVRRVCGGAPAEFIRLCGDKIGALIQRDDSGGSISNLIRLFPGPDVRAALLETVPNERDKRRLTLLQAFQVDARRNP
ncbi:hypothetical protein [Parendozoicomonas haliclonae]